MEKLLDKIEELISLCPSNWATLASEKTGKAISTVRKIRTGDLGKQNNCLQIELIGALKDIAEEYQNNLNQALA